MDLIAGLFGKAVGFFVLPIFTFIVEFIINKSLKKDWGYKVSITVLVLQLIIMALLKTKSNAS